MHVPREACERNPAIGCPKLYQAAHVLNMNPAVVGLGVEVGLVWNEYLVRYGPITITIGGRSLGMDLARAACDAHLRNQGPSLRFRRSGGFNAGSHQYLIAAPAFHGDSTVLTGVHANWAVTRCKGLLFH